MTAPDRSGAHRLFARSLEAASGAPAPAGVAEEGDTSTARVGEHEAALLETRWLAACATGEAARNAGLSWRQDALRLFARDGETVGTCRSGPAITAVDLDGDAFTDLAVGSLEGAVQIFRGGAGGPRPAGAVPVSGVSAFARGDLDCDGHEDLYAVRGAGLYAATPVFLLLRGDGSPEIVEAPGGLRRAVSAAAADIDRDGRLDVVEARAEGDIVWLRHLGTRRYEFSIRERGLEPRHSGRGHCHP